MTNKERYLRNSNIPPLYLRDKDMVIPLEDEKAYKKLETIKQNIVQFINEGQNLYISSNFVGNGKTQWATNLAKEYINNIQNVWINNGCPVLFINVGDFLTYKKQSITDSSMQETTNKIERLILSSKLVIFDDFADNTLSDYDYNYVYAWVNERTSHLKSSIFTTNTLPDDLIKYLPAKIVDRVLGLSEIIIFEGGSRRGK